MHNERLTLATLCGGEVQEKMDRALEKVAKNILDPKTDPNKKRSITLKISLTPDLNNYDDIKVDANVSVTLAPEIGISTRFFVDKDAETGGVVVMEHKEGEIKGQLDFGDVGMFRPEPVDVDYEPGEGSKVVDITRKTV